MSSIPRTIPGDWHPGSIPDNVAVADGAYIETSYSFQKFRSTRPRSVTLGKGCSVYLGTMFDLGTAAEVHVGDYAMLNGARIICDRSLVVGSHCLISWNVVIMDTYRAPKAANERVAALGRLQGDARSLHDCCPASPVRIESNVWVGFDSCILPGVTIGEGSIVGARSVVFESIPPYSIAVGNPARVIRTIDRTESATLLDNARSQSQEKMS